MAKPHSQYVCQQCGYSQVGWAGKCPNCGSWGSLVETIIKDIKSSKSRVKNGKKASEPVSLTSISSKKTVRISTKIPELDRVLGAGLVSGQVVLIAGEPGIGKSTLLLQVGDKIGNTLYVCGEESPDQIKIRAQRLGIKNKSIQLLESTDVDSVVDSIESQEFLKAAVVDSIQTMSTSDLTGLSGSVGQVRECTFRLLKAAKEKGTILFIVGHVTKEGTVAGPAVLAHLVDTLLWFEGEQNLSLRVLRAVKNRFGPTDEVGIFSMGEKGLISESDPQKLFLTRGKNQASGSVISSVLQGTRPILIEVQSLVVPSKLPFPKRNAQGVDLRRFEMLLAVLIRRVGLPLYEYDVLVNVAGGIKAYDPGIDLAICLSVASAFYDKVLSTHLVAIGEVGLLGEIRGVTLEEKRIKEAIRLGYTEIVSPKSFKFLSQAIKRYLR